MRSPSGVRSIPTPAAIPHLHPVGARSLNIWRQRGWDVVQVQWDDSDQAPRQVESELPTTVRAAGQVFSKGKSASLSRWTKPAAKSCMHAPCSKTASTSV